MIKHCTEIRIMINTYDHPRVFDRTIYDMDLPHISNIFREIFDEIRKRK